jgi:hypothetical protein
MLHTLGFRFANPPISISAILQPSSVVPPARSVIADLPRFYA